MVDVFTPEQRSYIMSCVKGRDNKATEQKLIGLFQHNRITGWRRDYPLFGHPDFVFPKERIALFVDGEFWHAHPKMCRLPATNTEFWKRKIERNRARDREVNRTLKQQGWTVVRIWQHQLKTREWKRKLSRGFSRAALRADEESRVRK